MIYALSLNPCMDKTAALPVFTPDAPNRVTVERLDVGGKGVNVAMAVHALGAPVTLTGFDYTGGPVQAAMARAGVPARLLPLKGELRVNMKLRETETGRTLEINERGVEVSPEELRQVRDMLLSLVRPGDWVSLSGSLPPGAAPDTYARLCTALREKGCLTAADCDGPALRAAVEARPSLIKPNAQEFFALTNVAPSDEGAALAACRELVRGGVGRVCLSRGPDGALLATARGAWRCSAAPVPVRGVQGAGDSMLAALLTAFSQGMGEGDALRFASAAAGASVMRPGTLLCRREDAETILSALPQTTQIDGI